MRSDGCEDGASAHIRREPSNADGFKHGCLPNVTTVGFAHTHAHTYAYTHSQTHTIKNTAPFCKITCRSLAQVLSKSSFLYPPIFLNKSLQNNDSLVHSAYISS